MVQLLPYTSEKSIPNIISILWWCQFSKIVFRSFLPVSPVDKSRMGTHQANQFLKKLHMFCAEERSSAVCGVNEAALQHKTYFGTDRIQHLIAQAREESFVSNPPFVFNQLCRFPWRILIGRGTSGNSVFGFTCLEVGDGTRFIWNWLRASLHSIGLCWLLFASFDVLHLLHDLLHLLYPIHSRLT